MKKLIRDKIPDIAKEQGRTLEIEIADKYSVPMYAIEKVQEELNEVINSKTREELLEELADLYEILDKYIEVMDFTKKDIQKARKDKNEKAGAFHNNLILIKKNSN
jgi:predicted house-cleaning noncanonical NTP pyrophosphatase (MazG superfamily)